MYHSEFTKRKMGFPILFNYVRKKWSLFESLRFCVQRRQVLKSGKRGGFQRGFWYPLPGF